ncbi:MAG: SAM-dependent methyltransferase [Terricaulis sp.]
MDFPRARSARRRARRARRPPDIVLSDMAANATGHARTDQIKTGALAEAAADFAMVQLGHGGAFITKAFQGGLDTALLAKLKQSFAVVTPR